MEKVTLLPNLPKAAIKLGAGVLSWSRDERVSDRYGAVMLMTESHTPSPIRNCGLIGGEKGRLVVQIAETRKSTHIGDLCRGLVPTTPKVGQLIELGSGTLFFDSCDNYQTIGLRPSRARDSDWLNPHALYNCHEQVVSLWFVPIKETQ